MIFEYHIAFALQLLALASGIVILSFARRPNQAKDSLLTIGGIVIIIATLLAMACNIYYATRYWEDGYFKNPQVHQCKMMHPKGMMHKMPMMDKMDGPSEETHPNTEEKK